MLNGENEHLGLGELNLKPRECWSFQVVADELGNSRLVPFQGYAINYYAFLIQEED